MIDTSKMALPKPGHIGKTKVVKLSKRKYENHRRWVWDHQAQTCHKCRRYMSLEQMHLHHTGGRGLGGGKRNDLKTQGLCGACHRKEHGQ